LASSAQLLKKYQTQKPLLTVNKLKLWDEVDALNEDLNIIDTKLERSISLNLDQFNSAFNSLDQLRLDMTDSSSKSKSIQHSLESLKQV